MISTNTKAETWSKEWPANGFYWLRGWRHYADLPIKVDGDRFFMLFDLQFKHKSELSDSEAVEFLGPISPADTAALVALREAVEFATKHGKGWILEDWHNWIQYHAKPALKEGK